MTLPNRGTPDLIDVWAETRRQRGAIGHPGGVRPAKLAPFAGAGHRIVAVMGRRPDAVRDAAERLGAEPLGLDATVPDCDRKPWPPSWQGKASPTWPP